MDILQWQADAFGTNIKASGFYYEVLKSINEVKAFFPTSKEVQGWTLRSRTRWLEKLKNLKILEMKRESKRGRWFYQINPYYVAIQNDIYKWLRRVRT